MKFFKISVLSTLCLLLFAPAASADVACELLQNFPQLRAESKNEMVENVGVRCDWDEGGDINNTAATEETPFAGSTFDLILRFSAPFANDDDMPVMLSLPGDNPETVAVETGYMAEGDMSASDVRFEDVAFPNSPNDVEATSADESWTVSDATNDNSGEFWITNIYVDATEAGDSVTVVPRMTASRLANNARLSIEADRVTIADVDQAMTLEFAADEKAETINACEPEGFSREVTVGEGYRMAWMAENDIQLMVSSGTVKGPATAGDVLERFSHGTDAAIYEVTNTSISDTQTIKLDFAPISADVGDELTLTAMFLPTFRSDEEFVASATITVGNYGACEGDSLLFPFISNMSGFDTGVALINNSDVDGECVLSWDGKVEEDYDDVQERDKMDVDAKDQTVFILSVANPGFQGLLSVACEFSNAYGYAFITDATGATGAQGYLAVRE
jgi:hypothetical protein